MAIFSVRRRDFINPGYLLIQMIQIDEQLQLERVHPVRREDLYDLMLEIPVPAVAALDFPFVMPGDFVEHIAQGKPLKAISEVWPALVGGGRTWFDCQQDKFVKAHEEVRRG